MTGQDFYQKLTSPSFKPKGTFPVKIPFRIDGKKIDVVIPIDLKMDEIEREVKEYLTAPPEVKKQFDAYAYWYDNYNKLIFSSMPEADACLFLAATAYCSANTALDQNTLEAAKLFEAVKADFATEEGRKMLAELSSFVKDNMNNEVLQKLKSYVDKGSAYAKLLAPKKDYKGGTVAAGARKGQEDVFSEITVSNAKIPNFNLFVKYFLAHNGRVTKKEIMDDFKDGRIDIGGTKISSFFMNLVFPEYKWNDQLNPATIDRWMIRVFFDKSVEQLVTHDIHDWIVAVTDRQSIKVGKKKDTLDDLDVKRGKALAANENRITQVAIMQLFSNDNVRQNLVKILNDEASKMGLTAYQLQALAWVNIRVRYKEPAAKFAKFEDVMEYAEEAARQIMQLDPNVNRVINTIKTLASGPRFKFKNPRDVIDTIENRGRYENVYHLPPKNDVEQKKQLKAQMANERWANIRVAVRDGRTADVFDLAVSGRKPLKSFSGDDRKSALTQALNWILAYNPQPSPAAA